MKDENNEYIDTISLRKSVRKWTDQDVSEEVLTRILKAAMLAPSARNLQEWRFIVVRSQETRELICKESKAQSFVGSAPVLLVCCAENTTHLMRCGQYSYPIDLAIAIDHITLCAVAERLGTCWIGDFEEEPVRDVLGIPADVRVIELLPIGYPEGPPSERRERYGFEEIVKYEKW